MTINRAVIGLAAMSAATMISGAAMAQASIFIAPAVQGLLDDTLFERSNVNLGYDSNAFDAGGSSGISSSARLMWVPPVNALTAKEIADCAESLKPVDPSAIVALEYRGRVGRVSCSAEMMNVGDDALFHYTTWTTTGAFARVSEYRDGSSTISMRNILSSNDATFFFSGFENGGGSLQVSIGENAFDQPVFFEDKGLAAGLYALLGVDYISSESLLNGVNVMDASIDARRGAFEKIVRDLVDVATYTPILPPAGPANRI